MNWSFKKKYFPHFPHFPLEAIYELSHQKINNGFPYFIGGEYHCPWGKMDLREISLNRFYGSPFYVEYLEDYFNHRNRGFSRMSQK